MPPNTDVTKCEPYNGDVKIIYSKKLLKIMLLFLKYFEIFMT